MKTYNGGPVEDIFDGKYLDPARRILELETELTMIRENVRFLFEGDYLPNPRSVINALYPQKYIVHSRVNRILTEQG